MLFLSTSCISIYNTDYWFSELVVGILLTNLSSNNINADITILINLYYRLKFTFALLTKENLSNLMVLYKNRWVITQNLQVFSNNQWVLLQNQLVSKINRRVVTTNRQDSDNNRLVYYNNRWVIDNNRLVYIIFHWVVFVAKPNKDNPTINLTVLHLCFVH